MQQDSQVQAGAPLFIWSRSHISSLLHHQVNSLQINNNKIPQILNNIEKQILLKKHIYKNANVISIF